MNIQRKRPSMSPSSRPADSGTAAPLSALNGLGPKSEAALRAAGITSASQLFSLGAVRAYLAVQRVWPGTSLNLLWALEGAISGIPWQVVAREHRLSLLLALESASGDAHALDQPPALDDRRHEAGPRQRVHRRGPAMRRLP